MLEKLKITKKLPLVMISFGIVSALVAGIIAYDRAYRALEKITEDKLFSSLMARKSFLEHDLNTITSDLTSLSHSPTVKSALNGFSEGWRELGDSASAHLVDYYVNENPYPKNERSRLSEANDGSRYSRHHKEFHDYFSEFIKLKSYHDLFLIDLEGNLVYTVVKESDFATNLLDGPWKDSHLTKVYNKAMRLSLDSDPAFEDYAFYAPSEGSVAGFIALPIIIDNIKIGVVALQMPIERISKILVSSVGSKESVRTYLVASDKLMRSHDRLNNQNNLLRTKIETESVNMALNGYAGVGHVKDYRNIEVFSAYMPFELYNQNWAIISDIDSADIMIPVKKMKKLILLGMFVVVLVIFFFGYLLASNLSKPILEMAETMKRLANNDLSTPIKDDNRGDEIGNMAKALKVFKQTAIERANYQEDLFYLAHHDTLTGLASRQYAIEQLAILTERCLKEGKNLALTFIDVNDLKTINDTLGHKEGDELLKQVGKLLKKSVRDIDIVARIGGDEFVVIMPSICLNLAEYKEIEQRISRKIQIPYPEINEDFTISVSLGTAIFPEDGTNPEELLVRADKVMYRNKQSIKRSRINPKPRLLYKVNDKTY